jgi:transposase
VTIGKVDVTATLKKVEDLLAKDKTLSDSTRSLLEVLVLIITLMADRLNLSSRNSSKPPSQDPNREKKPKKKSGKKPGGQNGHPGSTLKKVDNPDKTEVLKVDQSKLPKGVYTEVGYEKRQVFNIEISRVVTEYQAQILEDDKGNRFTAEFPPGVNHPVQYGTTVKAHAVYMSQFQLIPYDRMTEYFADQLDIPVSAGSLFNFNRQAYELLEQFDELAKQKLIESRLAHADETGVNINGDRLWLHCFSNDLWTYLYPHSKRGTEAMNEIGILPIFEGLLCHDHWKPYYRYDCIHCLCNAHHIRELTRAFEQDNQAWAKQMRELLETINRKVLDSGGVLSSYMQRKFIKQYRKILAAAEEECPPPDESRKKGQKGRIKRTKSRNLLERLRDFEDDVLRFMTIDVVPFTNNLGERDIRMTKVQQKISGCFRSLEGAKIFCRLRSYLSTCRKHNISSSDALELLFDGKLPDFDSFNPIQG